VAPSFHVELTPIGVRDPSEIERGIMAFARGSNGGLIMVGPGASVLPYRDLIVTIAGASPFPYNLDRARLPNRCEDQECDGGSSSRGSVLRRRGR
jgi:hypothetical protein